MEKTTVLIKLTKAQKTQIEVTCQIRRQIRFGHI
jgi:hypothetical protein